MLVLAPGEGMLWGAGAGTSEQEQEQEQGRRPMGGGH